VIFGAGIARQCLQAGLLNEIVIHLAAVLLGDGVRLYDSVGTDPIVLTRTALAATGQLIDPSFPHLISSAGASPGRAVPGHEAIRRRRNRRPDAGGGGQLAHRARGHGQARRVSLD
jgi:hypothetical protein